jgi:hypothetical protein
MPPDPRDRFDPGIDNGIDDEIQPGTVEVDGVQTEDPDRLRERAAEGTPFRADDVELRDGEVRVRDSARRRVARRRAAAGTPFAPEAFDVEGDSVEAPDPTERVDVTVFDDDVSGDVEIVNERTGERRDLGADVGGGPFGARIDAPDRKGEYEIQVGGETVERFEIGAAGAAVDDPGNLSRGWNGAILSADRGSTGVEQREYDPDARRGTDEDVVAGAGAGEALQAGADPEQLSQANPISESEGDRIAEALGQNDQQQQQQRDIGAGMTDQQLATRGSAANRRLRGRIASDREGLDASQVDLVATGDGLAFQADGATIGDDEQLDFGDATPGEPDGPGVRSLDEAIAEEGGEVTTTDAATSQEPQRGFPARFGQAQRGDEDTSEQFGDIAFTNPLTGDRVEEDLTDAADEFRAFATGATEFASRRDVPATGSFEPVGQAVAIDRGVDALTEEDIEDEGPTERFAEAGTVGAADALNPPAAAAEAKEIGEFVFTQPQRVGRAASSADDDSILPGVIGAADDAGEGVARSEFARDVERRTGRIIATASESARERPVSTAGGVAGGLAGGVVAGTAIGTAATRVPGVSGSDLSGRALQAAARGGRGARRFGRDDRAQTDLLFGGGGDGGGDTVDLVDEAALAEPDGEGRLASAPDDVTGGARDRQAAGLNQQGAFVGSNTRQQDAAFGGSGKPDTSGMDFSNVEFQELPRLQDRGETAGDAADVTGRSVNLDAIAAPGRRQAAGSSLAAALVAPALERQASAQSSSVFGGDAVFGEGIGADSRGDVFGRADTGARVDALGGGRSDAFDDLFGRADTGARVNTRTGTGTGTRTDVDVFGRVDTRTDARLDVDTRQDTRQDTRTDTRFDTRLDTRQDTRTDFDPPFRFDTDRPPEDDDRRDPPGPFSLFGAERDFDSGIAGGETVADAVFGGEFALDATTERDLSADRTFRL